MKRSLAGSKVARAVSGQAGINQAGAEARVQAAASPETTWSVVWMLFI